MRGGIKKIILPEKNKKDLRDIPAEAKEGVEFVFAHRMEDVLEQALEVPPSQWPTKDSAAHATA
jgi:ATP-dependent Lon protease